MGMFSLLFIVFFEETQFLQAGVFQMVQAVGRQGPTRKVSSPHLSLDLSLKSEAPAQPNSRAESHPRPTLPHAT